MLGQTCETLRQALYMTRVRNSCHLEHIQTNYMSFDRSIDSICLSAGLSVCLSCCLSIRHPAIYLYIYMFIYYMYESHQRIDQVKLKKDSIHWNIVASEQSPIAAVIKHGSASTKWKS